MAPPPTVYTSAGMYQPNLNSIAEASAPGMVGSEVMHHQHGHHSVSVVSHGPAVIVASRGPESDGDVTPTNERKLLPSHPVDEFSQGSMISRPAAYVVPSPKPIAMVTAKAKPSQNGSDLTDAKSNSISETTKPSAMGFSSYGTLPRKFSQKRQLVAVNGEEPGSVFHADAVYETSTCTSKSPASALCLERSKERFHIDANSSCHAIKKEPPVPPKRSHSFKTDLRLPVSNNHTSSGVPYANSIPHTLSSSSSMKTSSADNADTDLFGGAENILSEVIERLERGSSNNSSNSGSGSLTVRRNTGPRLGDWQDCRSANDSGSSSEDSDSGLDSRRSESNASLVDGTSSCAANSLSDMNTLPFANENVGTIKQRGSSSSKPSVIMMSDSGVIEPNSTIFTPPTSSTSVSLSSVSAPVS